MSEWKIHPEDAEMLKQESLESAKPQFGDVVSPSRLEEMYALSWKEIRAREKYEFVKSVLIRHGGGFQARERIEDVAAVWEELEKWRKEQLAK